jgi:hypothetical protein
MSLPFLHSSSPVWSHFPFFIARHLFEVSSLSSWLVTCLSSFPFLLCSSFIWGQQMRMGSTNITWKVNSSSHRQAFISWYTNRARLIIWESFSVDLEIPLSRLFLHEGDHSFYFQASNWAFPAPYDVHILYTRCLYIPPIEVTFSLFPEPVFVNV